jgi:hypothetical protein
LTSLYFYTLIFMDLNENGKKYAFTPLLED